MVGISRRGQVEQVLQQPMHSGGGKQIRATHNMGDALKSIIDDNRQVIAGGGVPAP